MPKLDVSDPRVRELIKQRSPVIIANSGVVQPALDRWTLPYLAEHAGSASKFGVYTSPSKYFLYSDASKNPGRFIFRSDIEETQMTMAQFVELFRTVDTTSSIWKAKGDAAGAGSSDAAVPPSLPPAGLRCCRAQKTCAHSCAVD